MIDSLSAEQTPPPPHPIAWLILYIPFGGLAGFVTIALGFRATQHGLSVTDGALLVGAQMLISWLKWLWAPIVDITLTPKRWYWIATVASALGVFAMSVMPLEKQFLGWLLAIIAVTSLINSVMGMAVEAMVAKLTPPEHVGRVSAWFQSGNLGGTALAGGLGLILFERFHSPAVAGACVAILFLICALPIFLLPKIEAHVTDEELWAAVKKVALELWQMLKSRAGFLSAFLCVLPVGTGAAQGTMAQAAVAAHWHAGAKQVAMLQGSSVGIVTMVGCFAGGWVCDRLNPRGAYMLFGLVLALIATAMAFAPAVVLTFEVGNLVYAFGVGLSYAAFTAVALTALGDAPAATGYNIFASLSNFPIWWLGLLLGWVADSTKGVSHGAPQMLLTEAGLGVAGVVLFAIVTRALGGRLFGKTASEAASVSS